MFLESARRMGVQPSDCLVLEDSPAGFEAATAAGMDYVVVGRPSAKPLPKSAGILAGGSVG